MSRSGRKRTCARVETSFPDHKRLKRIPLGARRAHAFAVWVAALCHSRHHELDGFCPTEALHAFAPNDVLQDLVDVGLLTRGEQEGLTGVVIVNYAEFNDTKQDIRGRLKRDRVRKDRGTIPRGIRSESDPVPVAIRSDSHLHSVGKLGEKSGVEKDLISDSDARAIPTAVAGDSAPSPPETSVRTRVSGPGTFGMHVDAYGEGIKAVTGVPYVKSGPFEAKMLEDCAQRANGLTGRELLAWYRQKAEKFARSVNPCFGYSANRFIAWLNGGERADQLEVVPSSRDLSRPESRNLNNLGAGLPPLPPLRVVPR